MNTIVSFENDDKEIKNGASVHSDNKLVEDVNAVNYYEPEELTKKILEETPQALEAFKDQAEMLEYIREALAATCKC